MELYLNDLLHISDDEMKNVKIRFNQHNGSENPLDLYVRDPEYVNSQYFLWRSQRRYFSVGQTAICFLKISEDMWLLTTIKKIKKDLDVIEGINYECEEIAEYKPYFGRLIIKFHKTFQTQGVFYKSVFKELIVDQILPSQYDGEDLIK